MRDPDHYLLGALVTTAIAAWWGVLAYVTAVVGGRLDSFLTPIFLVLMGACLWGVFRDLDRWDAARMRRREWRYR